MPVILTIYKAFCQTVLKFAKTAVKTREYLLNLA